MMKNALRILTGKKHRQIKLQRVGSRNIGIWVVGTSNQLFIRGSETETKIKWFRAKLRSL